jgi:hypothetical protein
MKLDRLAAISEIVSSFAIVATLAYLVIQTKEMSSQTQQMVAQTEQTNLALNANTQATIMFADLNYLLTNLEYPQLIPGRNLELSEDDEARLIILISAASRSREFLWTQKQAGFVDDATWNSYLSVLVSSIESSPGYRQAWDRVAENLSSDFVREVQSRISE